MKGISVLEIVKLYKKTGEILGNTPTCEVLLDNPLRLSIPIGSTVKVQMEDVSCAGVYVTGKLVGVQKPSARGNFIEISGTGTVSHWEEDGVFIDADGEMIFAKTSKDHNSCPMGARVHFKIKNPVTESLQEGCRLCGDLVRLLRAT